MSVFQWILWSLVYFILLGSIVWFFTPPVGPVGPEGFAALPAEPTSSWDALRNFFHYQMSPVEKPAGISVDPGILKGLSEGTVDSALYTPGYSTANNRGESSLFKRLLDPTNPNASEDEKCRAYSHPSFMRGGQTDQQQRTDTGCGWWFVSDPAVPSVATFGYGPNNTLSRATGPENAEGLPAGGRWIWDIAEATKAEEIKRCKRISTCSLIASQPNCGFCPSNGYAVPVTAAGDVKYPEDEEGSCGDAGNIVTQSNQCPDIVIKPRYFSGDYNYDANGNPIRDERYAAIRNPQGIRIQDPCVSKDGRLSLECRLNMCLEVGGCTAGKGLHRIVQQDGNLTETDRVAMFYLRKRMGIDIPPAMWEDGAGLNKADAEAVVSRLNGAATSGPTSQGRSAARWFLDETPFNLCDFAETDMSRDIPLQCIQREFRKAGCQPVGSAYPTSTFLYADMSYGAVKSQFRDLYTAMNNQDVKNVRQQDETIQKCLGIEVKRATDTTFEMNPNVCREQGIEYWFTTIPTLGSRVLYARHLVRETPLSLVQQTTSTTGAGAEFGHLLAQKGRTRGWTARTFVELSGAPVTVTLRISPPTVAKFYGFWVNQQSIIPLTGTGGTTFTTRLPPYMRSEIEVRFETGGGSIGPADFGAPTLTFDTSSPPPLYLAQSAWKPVISLRATRDGFADDNRYFLMTSSGATQKMGNEGRWSMPLKGSSVSTQTKRGIWMEAVGTVAANFHFASLPIGSQTTLWRLDGGNGGLSDTVMSMSVMENRLVFTIQTGTSIFQMRSVAIVKTGWQHVAVVLERTLSDTRLYLQGIDVTGKDPTATGTFNTNEVQFLRTVLGGAGFDGGIAWFHIYEESLSSSQVGRDLNYDNPRYSDREADILVRP